MDQTLVALARQGDQEAFATLCGPLGDRFYGIAHRILRDTDMAEDATQRALLSVWRQLHRLRDPARFDAWSYRLAVNACYAEGRKERRWAPNLRLLTLDEPLTADPATQVANRDQLERAFRRLSVEHRAVVVLHHYLDMTLPDVAETLEIPIGTARSRLHYAMRALRAALDADSRATASGGSR